MIDAYIYVKTKRGDVCVEFDGCGEVGDVRAKDPANWDSKTWKRERPHLIRRARTLCAKIGAKDIRIPHSKKLEGKIIVVHHKTRGVTAAGVYLLSGDKPDYFFLVPDTERPYVFPKYCKQSEWGIVAVYDPKED
jgi:hypothetical protein